MNPAMARQFSSLLPSGVKAWVRGIMVVARGYDIFTREGTQTASPRDAA